MTVELAKISGFFSYCHGDNTRDRLHQLVEDIKQEYAVQTAESLELFVDNTSLEWGDRWRESIMGSIDSASFFIPPDFCSSLEPFTPSELGKRL